MEPTHITMDAQGYPTSPLDIPSLVAALATVPNQHIGDNAPAINQILLHVRRELSTVAVVKIEVGNYAFAFTQEIAPNEK